MEVHSIYVNEFWNFFSLVELGLYVLSHPEVRMLEFLE